MTDLILVADVTKEQVLFTSTCFETTHQSHGDTQVVIQVAKHAVPQMPGEIDKDRAIECIDGVLDIIKGSLTVGCFVAPELAPFLAAAAGVCSFVQSIMAFIPHEDPVMKKMEELNDKIVELSEKTQHSFDDMKAFITENNFNLEIVTETSILRKYVQDFLKFGTPESIESLRKAYEENTPLTIAYTLVSLLDQRATNPLVVALDVEDYKTEATFNKWKKVVDVVLGDLQVYKVINSDRMFNELREYLPVYARDHWNRRNQEKSEEVRNHINGLYDKYWLADDAYYTIFFDVYTGLTLKCSYDLKCTDQKDRVITSWDKGEVNAIIYRSRTGNQLSQSDDQDALDEIWEIGKRVHRNYDLKDYLSGINLKLHDDRFYFLCARNASPAIRYAHHFDHKLGPGAWADINGKDGQWLVIGHP
ncbi:hypothetical protein CAEBREN_07245 [Caenorhabditis brenneri]|uniref:Uncharacterized protein n=1 Tax=Caenorhabditis brenneri TaxID=135651 RepID=G0P425_CAEBE|nr:hypothetical protein CAEBREN_07245 [Caenorhabditis brenneri]